MITAPCCYGKLPCLGDYFQYRAAQTEMGLWWSHFVKMLEKPLSWGQPAQHTWSFVLPQGLFSWSTHEYVLGAITLSSDRIGRRYPLIIWQKASPKGLRHASLFGTEAHAHNWLFWLSRFLMAAATNPVALTHVAMPHNARHFEKDLDALWELHRPRWSENFGLRSCVDKEAHCLRLTGPPPQDDVEGVLYMPWADWPQRLWQGASLCYFWQQDPQGRYLRAMVNRTVDEQLLAALFVQE